MTLTHNSVPFSVDEAAIYAMLTDVAGSAPTYSAKVPIPGIKGCVLNPDVLFKELFGDNKVLAVASIVRKFMCDLTYAKMSDDVLAILTGGTVVDTGTTPSQTSTFSIGANSITGYFKIEFRVLNAELPGPAGGGSVTVRFPKCKASDFKPAIGVPEDFGVQAFTLAAIQPIGTAKMIEKVGNETAAALSS